MAKNSLLIRDSERYGPSSPASLVGNKEEKDRKTGPTITLVGKQVDAFCACSLEVGTKGKATVDFVVKAVSAGDRYGSDLPTTTKPKEVTLLLTNAEAMDSDDDDEEAEGEGEEGSDKEEASETATEEKTEDAADGAPMGEMKKSKKPVSPKEASL